MKISERWLREWVNPPISTQQLSKQLGQAGLEVEAVESAAPPFSGVIVAEVLTVAKHPDSDHLHLCEVSTGKETLKIVCGAANVRAGLKVALAMIGAVLPGNLQIKKAKLRGQESHGMLCSGGELGLGETDGILELPQDAPVGKDFREYFELDDFVFDLKLTPNRGDCLSVYGIARELGVINKMALSRPDNPEVACAISDRLELKITAKEACPHYVGRVIRGINLHAQTPLWMQERLRRAGLRSIHPVVDVANYVMLELGQPLHAFDISKLQGGIEVRLARAGEEITLLDQQQIQLNAQDLVISDAKNAHALAGIMGGFESRVTTETQAIFLESAYFEPTVIRRSARRYHIYSDASHRYERGVDPQLQRAGIERATQLLLMIAGGQAGPVVEFSDEKKLNEQTPIRLRRSRIPRLLGININDAEVEDILTRLEIAVTREENGWRAIAPSHRFDLKLEVDLIEELARIHGYEHIPRVHPFMHVAAKPSSEALLPLERIRSALVDRGYYESITYSFTDARLQKQLDPVNAALELSNPISSDMAVMRTSLWPGLLQALRHNQYRQQKRVKLFETGLCFIKGTEKLLQLPKLGGIAWGQAYPEQWGMPARSFDFFDVKADIEALLQLAQHEYRFIAAEHPALHPGQSAQLILKERTVGWIGALHPALLRSLEVEGPVFLFEFDLPALQQGVLPRYEEISKYPSVRRDIAFILDERWPVQEVIDKITLSAKKLLKNIQIFDIYRGEGIDFGKKSVALALTFQDPSRTLVDEEIDAVMQEIGLLLQEHFSATLRA